MPKFVYDWMNEPIFVGGRKEDYIPKLSKRFHTYEYGDIIRPCNCKAWLQKSAWNVYEAFMILEGIEPSIFYQKHQELVGVKTPAGDIGSAFLDKMNAFFDMVSREYAAKTLQLLINEDRPRGTTYAEPRTWLLWAKDKGYTLPQEIDAWLAEQTTTDVPQAVTVQDEKPLEHWNDSPIVIVPMEVRPLEFEEVAAYLHKCKYDDRAKAFTLNCLFKRSKKKIGVFLSGRATGDPSAKVKYVNKLLEEAKEKGYRLTK